MGNRAETRDIVTAVGGGSSMIAPLLLWVGARGSHPLLYSAGKIFTLTGIVLLLFRGIRSLTGATGKPGAPGI